MAPLTLLVAQTELRGAFQLAMLVVLGLKLQKLVTSSFELAGPTLQGRRGELLMLVRQLNGRLQ